MQARSLRRVFARLVERAVMGNHLGLPSFRNRQSSRHRFEALLQIASFDSNDKIVLDPDVEAAYEWGGGS